MIKFLKNIRGLVLAETLVAVAVLATAAVVLGGIIQNGVTATKVSRDYLVAQNLLQEGAEMVKALRNTNMLLRPADVFPGAESCWLFLDPQQLANNPGRECEVGVAMVDTSYIYRYDNGQLMFVSTGGDLDLERNDDQENNAFLLSLVNGLYSYEGGPGAEASKFYRSIEFTNIALDKRSASFQVKVQWDDGSRIRAVARDFMIYNLF